MRDGLGVALALATHDERAQAVDVGGEADVLAGAARRRHLGGRLSRGEAGVIGDKYHRPRGQILERVEAEAVGERLQIAVLDDDPRALEGGSGGGVGDETREGTGEGGRGDDSQQSARDEEGA